MLQSILLIQATRNSPGVPPLKAIEDEPETMTDRQVVRASADAPKGSRAVREDASR